MNCKNCGKENYDGAAFCIGCGTALPAAPVNQPFDGPTKVFTSPKKKNIAALALGALSVLLAIMLVLSMTGVFGASGGAAASRSFGTPEDAINYFMGCLKAGDFDGALSACAINEMAQGFNYKAYAEQSKVLMPLEILYLPSEYPQYVRYNTNKISQGFIEQMTRFSISFGFSEENAGLLNYSTILLKDGKLPENLIEEFDPNVLSGLELVEIGIPHDSNITENIKKRAALFGADDAQSRLVLYKYSGNYYIGGFTAIEYGGRWMIQDMRDMYGGAYGFPYPISDKSVYYNEIE